MNEKGAQPTLHSIYYDIRQERVSDAFLRVKKPPHVAPAFSSVLFPSKQI
jgi:hypothetical protein